MAVGRRRPASCPPSARLLRGHISSTARGSVQRLAGEAGPQQRTDPTVDTSVRSRGGTSRAPSCGVPRGAGEVGSPRGGGRPLAARRWSSARRAAAAVSVRRFGFSGGGSLLFRGWLWVLRDDRNGCSRPSGPGAMVTRIARARRRYNRPGSITRYESFQ
jgi:hypothetical protein